MGMFTLLLVLLLATPPFVHAAADEDAGRRQKLAAILAETPDDPAALKSLAGSYVAAGDHAQAEALLVGAAAAYPSHDVLGVLLGDFYRDEQNLDKALAAYRQAADGNPTAALPRRRIVEMYVDRLPASRADLVSALALFAPAFPSVAEYGHRAIIRRLYRSDPSAAEESFVRWVEIMARTRRISRDSVATLPSDWTGRAFLDLKKFLEAPDREPYGSWWVVSSSEGHHVLALVALALGEAQLAAGDPPGAETRWNVGLRFVPDYSEYQFGRLRGRTLAPLELQTALASLYFKFPRLDPGDVKFNRAINAIFQSKGEAYRAGDLETIQRHHVILGAILAQKGVWQSPSNPALNAIFQLEHAISTAEERDRRDGTYQPLPEIKALLADGNVALGRPDQARSRYLDAALAFLDTDDLARAKQTLDRAAGVGGGLPGAPPRAKEMHAQLASVLATRQAIEQAAPDTVARDRRNAWLSGSALSALPAPFVARQRFKALSDLSGRSAATGNVEAASRHASEAFKTAVEGVSHFTGAPDLVRLEKIRGPATQGPIIEKKPVSLNRAPAATPSGKTWTLSLPSEKGRSYVAVPGDEVLASRIVWESKRDPGLAAATSGMVIKRGQITIPSDAGGHEEVKRSLEKIPGVGSVSVTPTRR